MRRILLGKLCKDPRKHRLYHMLGKECECIQAINDMTVTEYKKWLQDLGLSK